MSKITKADVGYFAFALLREAVFLIARIICMFRGHRDFVWKTFSTDFGPMRQRSCQRCSKTESDYSNLNERGKQIVGLVRSTVTGRSGEKS
jgi:hypothetical protein